MTRQRIYEVGDALIHINLVLTWDDTYGNVFKNSQLIFIILYKVQERNFRYIISTYTPLSCTINYNLKLTKLWPSYLNILLQHQRNDMNTGTSNNLWPSAQENRDHQKKG